MAYIYVITNQVNQKQYVGKTIFSIEKRWKEHQRDSLKQRCEKRPLYEAMSKYGVENFEIEEVEECSPEEVETREIYWINKLNTFHSGYNATLGGDGKQWLDYSEILREYDNTLLSVAEIAQKCNCCEESVRNIVSQYRENIDWQMRYTQRHISNNLGITGKAVRCIEEQKEFPSATRASNWLVENGKIKSQAYGRNTIPKVCRGKQHKVGGYHWEYV